MAAIILTLVILATEVVRKLNQLDRASSDNVQWTLSQTEVEFLELLSDLAVAQHSATPDLEVVRREFDIFYSRINTVAESSLYAPLRSETDYAAALKSVQDFLDDAVAIIDDDDDVLTARLPELHEMAEANRLNIRMLSVAGLDHFARAGGPQARKRLHHPAAAGTGGGSSVLHPRGRGAEPPAALPPLREADA